MIDNGIDDEIDSGIALEDWFDFVFVFIVSVLYTSLGWQGLYKTDKSAFSLYEDWF